MKHILKSKDGTSMVELLVSFVIVLLVVGLYSTVVLSSSNVLQKARLMATANQEFDEYYYSIKQASDTNVVDYDEPLYLEVDMEKTHPLNRPYNISLRLNNKMKLRSVSLDGRLRYKVIYDE